MSYSVPISNLKQWDNVLSCILGLLQNVLSSDPTKYFEPCGNITLQENPNITFVIVVSFCYYF